MYEGASTPTSSGNSSRPYAKRKWTKKKVPSVDDTPFQEIFTSHYLAPKKPIKLTTINTRASTPQHTNANKRENVKTGRQFRKSQNSSNRHNVYPIPRYNHESNASSSNAQKLGNNNRRRLNDSNRNIIHGDNNNGNNSYGNNRYGNNSYGNNSNDNGSYGGNSNDNSDNGNRSYGNSNNNNNNNGNRNYGNSNNGARNYGNRSYGNGNNGTRNYGNNSNGSNNGKNNNGNRNNGNSDNNNNSNSNNNSVSSNGDSSYGISNNNSIPNSPSTSNHNSNEGSDTEMMDIGDGKVSFKRATPKKIEPVAMDVEGPATIEIENLHPHTTVDDVKMVCSRYGKIKSCICSGGYAQVTYENGADGSKAIQELNGKLSDGDHPLRVTMRKTAVIHSAPLEVALYLPSPIADLIKIPKAFTREM
ncbi:hypothetical protein BGX26_008576 [Mortierella sp. AD094]|nr:hypothetical protein BGX26_008576 [Mortierella sp. AD094]